MNLWELSAIGFGLSMDAFAVSICKGIAINKVTLKKCFIVAFTFSFFQGMMPLIGYYFGNSIASLISEIGDYVSFVLFMFVGGSMIKESYEKKEISQSLAWVDLLVLAIATSIDAFASGISFSFLDVDILMAIVIICLITFIFCLIGVMIGNVFESQYQYVAMRIGGMVLIIMAIQVIVEHIIS